MSDSNRVRVVYAPETVYGTRPVSPTNFYTVRMTGESLSGQPRTVVSNELRTDRMVADQLKVGTDTGGDVQFEFSAKSFDDQMAAAMCSTWQTDVLKVGTDDISATYYVSYTDIDEPTGRHIELLGQRVGVFGLNFQFGQILTGQFTLAGADVQALSSDPLSSDTIVAAPTTDVLNASSDVQEIRMDGVLATSCISQFTFNINNNLRAKECIGADTPDDQIKGRADITGSMQTHLDAASWTQYEAVLAQTERSVSFKVGDSDGNTYTFLFPRVKLSASAPAATGPNQDVFIESEFTALYDATEGSSLTITRVQP